MSGLSNPSLLSETSASGGVRSTICCARSASRSSLGAKAGSFLNMTPKRPSLVRPAVTAMSEPRGAPVPWPDRVALSTRAAAGAVGAGTLGVGALGAAWACPVTGSAARPAITPVRTPLRETPSAAVSSGTRILFVVFIGCPSPPVGACANRQRCGSWKYLADAPFMTWRSGPGTRAVASPGPAGAVAVERRRAQGRGSRTVASRSSAGTVPKCRESTDTPRLSPMTKTCPSGTVTGPK